MSRNGGYAIMDLKGYSFQRDVAVNVDSSVFAITQRTKPIMISGLKLDGLLLPDFYAIFTSSTLDDITTAESKIELRSIILTIAISHNNTTNLTTFTIAI